MSPATTSSPEATKSVQSHITTQTVLLVLATIFIILRLVARYNVAAKYGLDEWLILTGLLTVYMLAGLNYGMIAHGMGLHARDLPQADLVLVYQQLLAFECIYVASVAVIKLSILAMYLRIFPSRGFRATSWAVGATVVTWCVALALVSIFQCSPVAKAWLPWRDGACIDLKAAFIANGVPNIVTDVIIMVMPVRQVWNLHAPMAQKIHLLCTFGLGGFVMIATIYRFTTLMAFDINDTTYTLATPVTWSVIETSCGVICACLPLLRPLYKKLSHKLGSSGAREKTTTTTCNRKTTGGTRNTGGLRYAQTELATMHSRTTASRSAFHRLECDQDGQTMYLKGDNDGDDDDRGAAQPELHHGGAGAATVFRMCEGGPAEDEFEQIGEAKSTGSGHQDLEEQQGKGFV